MSFVNSQTRPYSIISSSTFYGTSISGSGPTGYLPANNGRAQVYAQVVGSGGPLWISLNNQRADSGNFQLVLKPASADMGADGGVWSDTSFQGAVFVSGANLCKFVLWESRN